MQRNEVITKDDEILNTFDEIKFNEDKEALLIYLFDVLKDVEDEDKILTCLDKLSHCGLKEAIALNYVTTDYATEEVKPIHYAAHRTHFRVCSRLIELGADYQAKYNDTEPGPGWQSNPFSFIGNDLCAKDFFIHYEKKYNSSDIKMLALQETFLAIHSKELSEHKVFQFFNNENDLHEKLMAAKTLLSYLRGTKSCASLTPHLEVFKKGKLADIYNEILQCLKIHRPDDFHYLQKNTSLLKTHIGNIQDETGNKFILNL